MKNQLRVRPRPSCPRVAPLCAPAILCAAIVAITSCSSAPPTASAVSIVTTPDVVAGCTSLGGFTFDPADLSAAVRVVRTRQGNTLLLRDWRLTPSLAQNSPAEAFHCATPPASELSTSR
jgi:hypothetical protein